MQIVYEKIDSIITEEYNGQVVNLTTENEEYIVSDVVVHNCPHVWQITAKHVAKDDCPLLWMGV